MHPPLSTVHDIRLLAMISGWLQCRGGSLNITNGHYLFRKLWRIQYQYRFENTTEQLRFFKIKSYLFDDISPSWLVFFFKTTVNFYQLLLNKLKRFIYKEVTHYVYTLSLSYYLFFYSLLCSHYQYDGRHHHTRQQTLSCVPTLHVTSHVICFSVPIL